MAKAKVLVSLDEELLARVDIRCREHGLTRSAWMTRAVEHVLAAADAGASIVVQMPRQAGASGSNVRTPAVLPRSKTVRPLSKKDQASGKRLTGGSGGG